MLNVSLLQFYFLKSNESLFLYTNKSYNKSLDPNIAKNKY